MKKKTSQTGRSMVEMLGVLAVIGVLSIGGIVGYKYAMQKRFENEIVEMVGRVILAIKSESQKEYSEIFDENTWNTGEANKAEVTKRAKLLCQLYLGKPYCQTPGTAGFYWASGFRFPFNPKQSAGWVPYSVISGNNSYVRLVLNLCLSGNCKNLCHSLVDALDPYAQAGYISSYINANWYSGSTATEKGHQLCDKESGSTIGIVFPWPL